MLRYENGIFISLTNKYLINVERKCPKKPPKCVSQNVRKIPLKKCQQKPAKNNLLECLSRQKTISLLILLIMILLARLLPRPHKAPSTALNSAHLTGGIRQRQIKSPTQTSNSQIKEDRLGRSL